MIYATYLIIMSILSQTTIHFFDFPVNIGVASFMVYAFHGSTFLQSGVHCWLYSALMCVSVGMHEARFFQSAHTLRSLIP